MKKWNEINPPYRNELAKSYYDYIKSRKIYRFGKRFFDIVSALILIILLFLPSLVIGIVIVCDSRGGAFFCQTRIGRYGKPFKILKFRTMAKNSEGNKLITSKDDCRITRVGKFLRKTHFDEFPQLLNVLVGQMSFIGTRPEVKQYVDLYKDEWYATLFMRPGITSTASYSCDDEAKFISDENTYDIYLEKILPYKMNLNLYDLMHLSFFRDIVILWKTIF